MEVVRANRKGHPRTQRHLTDEQLENKVHIREFGCWNWKGRINPGGYAGLSWRHIKEQVGSRIVWRITKGNIPKGMQVCHHCDNRKCMRPDHLFLGTIADNQNDKVIKNRQHRPVGSRNPWASISEEVVPQIRALRLEGLIEREIAARFGCSRGVVSRVLTGRSWGHVK